MNTTNTTPEAGDNAPHIVKVFCEFGEITSTKVIYPNRQEAVKAAQMAMRNRDKIAYVAGGWPTRYTHVHVERFTGWR